MGKNGYEKFKSLVLPIILITGSLKMGNVLYRKKNSDILKLPWRDRKRAGDCP